jgi:hypothetical protein
MLGGPARGFGPMWEKTYTMTLEGISPAAAIAPWQRSFPSPGPWRRRHGVTVLHTGAESVTVSTLPTAPLACWITVSAERAGPLTDVRVQILMRARDPLSELAFALGGYRRQDRLWIAALTALAGDLALPEPAVVIRGVCLDSRHQWRNTRNVCHGPVLRGLARTVTAPCLLLGLAGPRVPGSRALALLFGAPPARRRAAVPGNLMSWAEEGSSLDAGGRRQRSQGQPGRGGGVEASRARGGGVEASRARGGGVEASSARGGGVEASRARGGGVEAGRARGGGVEASRAAASPAALLSGALSCRPRRRS